MISYLNKIQQSIIKHDKYDALFINSTSYTYHDFAKAISKIRFSIRQRIEKDEKLIGLVTNDDLETYASIIALWLEGKAYVPVNPETPLDRNTKIFELTETKFVIDSSKTSEYDEGFEVISSKKLIEQPIDLDITVKIEPDHLAYILFTSGTTGTPKGVPITFDNIEGLVLAIENDTEFNLVPTDRCLQMFELTFDFSVVTYLFPLLYGSCIYTIPKNTIKYFYIFKLIKEQRLTVLTMVPSIIHYLRPYFKEINALDVRYCSFGGGALHSDIAGEWSDCLPNCQIFNYYGPTEYTVYSGYYPYHKKKNTKSYNGIVSIGTPLSDVEYIIVNSENEEVGINETGELCLAGRQLTPGYWKNEVRNNEAFFYIKKGEESIRYYKTGDLCYKDEQGDFMYVARADFQVKIRGYRVELAEIEFHAKAITDKINLVVIDVLNSLGNSELAIVLESEPFDTTDMIDYMKTKMPNYMIPNHIKFVDQLPHSINGKINRKELKKMFNLKKK